MPEIKTNKPPRGYSMIIGDRSAFAYSELYLTEESNKHCGKAEFFSTPVGVVISLEVSGLPDNENKNNCGKYKIYEMRISKDYFAYRCEEKRSIPPIFSKDGFAWSTYLSDKITPREIIGKEISLMCVKKGKKKAENIACGIIKSK